MPRLPQPAEPFRFLIESQPRVVLRSAQGVQSCDSPHYERLSSAAIELFSERGLDGVRFSDVCEAAGLSRQTGYRLFPRGLDALTEYLEVCTLAAIIQSISKKRRSMHSSVGFKQTFEAGVEGVVEAFRQAPWTREVLRWNRGLLASYLLNTDPDGLWAVLSSYTAACARSFRCLTDNVDEHAKTLVWEVLSTWLVKYPPPEDRRLAWPHIEHVRAVIMEPLERFIAVVRPSNEEQDSAAVPDVAVPSALEPSQAAF